MTDEPVQNENPTNIEQPTIKTPADLAIEKLTARLDALETENRDLRNANQGLWAQLHPVTPAVTEQPAMPPAPGSGVDTDLAVLKDKLGLKEE